MEVQEQDNLLKTELQVHACCSPESVSCPADTGGGWQDGLLSALLKVDCHLQPEASSTARDILFNRWLFPALFILVYLGVFHRIALGAF